MSVENANAFKKNETPPADLVRKVAITLAEFNAREIVNLNNILYKIYTTHAKYIQKIHHNEADSPHKVLITPSKHFDSHVENVCGQVGFGNKSDYYIIGAAVLTEVLEQTGFVNSNNAPTFPDLSKIPLSIIRSERKLELNEVDVDDKVDLKIIKASLKNVIMGFERSDKEEVPKEHSELLFKRLKTYLPKAIVLNRRINDPDLDRLVHKGERRLE
jgi:hypothetical protein